MVVSLSKSSNIFNDVIFLTSLKFKIISLIMDDMDSLYFPSSMPFKNNCNMSLYTDELSSVGFILCRISFSLFKKS